MRFFREFIIFILLMTQYNSAIVYVSSTTGMFKHPILKNCNFLTKISSASENKILLWGLEDKKHYNGKKRPFEKNEDLMRTHFRAFEDPKSLFSLKCEMVIKKRVFTTLHFLWLMCSCSLWYNCYICHFPWDACTTRCWWILLYFSIYGRGTPKIHHNRGKWGLWCKMRTKWEPIWVFQDFQIIFHQNSFIKNLQREIFLRQKCVCAMFIMIRSQ